MIIGHSGCSTLLLFSISIDNWETSIMLVGKKTSKQNYFYFHFFQAIAMLASRYSEGKNLFFNAFYSHTPSSCMWPWLCPKLYKSAPKVPRTPYNFLFNICFPPWDHSIHKIEDLPVLYLRSPSRCHSAWHMTVHKRYLLKEETHVHWTELFLSFCNIKRNEWGSLWLCGQTYC